MTPKRPGRRPSLRPRVHIGLPPAAWRRNCSTESSSSWGTSRSTIAVRPSRVEAASSSWALAPIASSKAAA